ncbi:hypothetical protein [Methylomonas sp. AM2-LC]|uniref:hypothetical protein n=1 Tax=Methylomonas sp. AM2-LC TaxID=3153301 RepID=UPI0032675423
MSDLVLTLTDYSFTDYSYLRFDILDSTTKAITTAEEQLCLSPFDDFLLLTALQHRSVKYSRSGRYRVRAIHPRPERRGFSRNPINKSISDLTPKQFQLRKTFNINN